MAKRSGMYMGVISSIITIMLSACFLLLTPNSKDTIIRVFSLVTFPTCLFLIASLIRRPLLMLLFLIWSIPIGIYLGVAVIPSIWNLFVISLLFSFISILTVLSEKREEISKKTHQNR
ncbi:hypothetical protein SAMN05444416_101134 [Thermoactinomyces sp. DSM 45892]|nr:hypothetical protein SAMN05444416_101134 [Thermoactinomyces sp. DSM 45892]